MSDAGSGIESGTADRLFFFSDAVVAIAITLLALDLPVPRGNTVAEFWSSVRRNDGEYLSFLISFVVVAVSWGHHHGVFRYAERSDQRLRTYNMVWLLMIIMNPFATRMLTAQGHDSLAAHALRFGFYALLQVVSAIAFLAMVHHMVSHHLQSAETPPELVTETDWSSYGLMAGFALSIPVFFVTTYAWVLWIVAPLLVGWVHQRHGAAR